MGVGMLISKYEPQRNLLGKRFFGCDVRNRIEECTAQHPIVADATVSGLSISLFALRDVGAGFMRGYERKTRRAYLTEAQNPDVKSFISYSWTSDQHEQWVLDLAHRLSQDGVHVILDKWDLQVGHDANAFMEQMVTDSTVKKVLMICDRVYTEKANGRSGGVGKEAQILTAEIYRKAAQDKYAALITERDDTGEAYVPTYYGGRQYIDFTEAGRQDERYQELLRWIYDKPKHVRPRRGNAPEFITNPNAVAPGTLSAFKRADAALRSGQPGGAGHLRDFADALVSEFESLRPIRDDKEPWDEVVLKTAIALRPSLHQLAELILAEARFSGAALPSILNILERIGAFMYRPPDVRQWNESDFDPYKMICYEAFLSLTAIFISEQRFDLLYNALSHPYLIERSNEGTGRSTSTYRIFCQDIESLRQRNVRLNANRVDIYADTIFETYKIGFPKFVDLLQADIFLYLHANVVIDSVDWHQWWPRLLLYGGRNSTELFARSESLSFYENWSTTILGKLSPTDFRSKIAELTEGTRRSFGFMGPNLQLITNSANIGIRP